jgi:hypothetical protein
MRRWLALGILVLLGESPAVAQTPMSRCSLDCLGCGRPDLPWWCWILIPDIWGVLWSLLLCIHTCLSFVLRKICITSDDFVYPRIFKETVSGWRRYWPELWMHSRYLLPWVPAPEELSAYSSFTRVLFWVTRIAGTLTFFLLFLGLLSIGILAIMGCLSGTHFS